MDKLLGRDRGTLFEPSTSFGHDLSYGCGPFVYPHWLLAMCRPRRGYILLVDCLLPKRQP